MGRQRLVRMVFGGNVGHGHHGQVMVEPQTHTLSFKASWAWMSPWPQMSAHVSQAEITPVVHSSYPRYKVSLGQQHESSWWPRSWASAKPLIVSNAMNINTEHGYNWAMDPNMASGCTSGLVSSKPWVALQDTQFCMVMAIAWSWDTTMASGFSPEPWFLHCTMVTGTKNINISLTVVEPWIPNMGSGWHRLGCLHGPKWQLCLPCSSF